MATKKDDAAQVKHAEDQKRAAAMKAGPNSIVEEVHASKPKKGAAPRPEPKPTPKADPKTPERQLQPINLRTFLSLEFGRRVDQAAGFAHHARNQGPRTIHEWRAEHAAYLSRPVK